MAREKLLIKVEELSGFKICKFCANLYKYNN